jgi:hypothetical protein
MRTTADRQQVLAALNAWLATPPRLAVHRVLAGQRPAYEQPAYFMEVPRLILGLAGRGVPTMENNREVLFELEAGQVLSRSLHLDLPGAAHALPLTRRRAAAGIDAADHPRPRGMARDGTISGRYLAQWHTLETLGSKGEHLSTYFAPNQRPAWVTAASPS